MSDAPSPRLPIIVDSDPTAQTLAADAANPFTSDDPPLDYLTALWLSEQHSPRTRVEYKVILDDYRAALAKVTLDLDSGDHNRLADVALLWSQRLTQHPTQVTRRGQSPSTATQARRLSVVSSFYLFGMRHGMREWRADRKSGERSREEVDANPLRKLKRPSVQRYAEATPLEARELVMRLRMIDRATLEGKRDFALILVAVMTGKRLAELAGLTCGAIAVARDRTLTVRWVAKRGKILHDKLDTRTGAALRDWLCAAYALDDLRSGALPATAPVWLPLSRDTAFRAREAGKQEGLSRFSIRRVFMRRLGISKVHASRHTFAVMMEQSGAKLTDIQARLGHASSATTALYMNATKASINPYSDRLAALLGAAGLE